MSRVPWSTFARCRVSLAMVDIRPPIRDDGRHSTVDLSRPEFQDYMSNDDFSRSHLSNGLMARFRPERIGGNSDLILTITKHAGPVSVRTEKLCGDPRTSHIPRQMQLITVGELRKDWTNWPRLGRDATDAQRSEEHTSELQSRLHLVCRLLLEKKQINMI